MDLTCDPFAFVTKRIIRTRYIKFPSVRQKIWHYDIFHGFFVFIFMYDLHIG